MGVWRIINKLGKQKCEKDEKYIELGGCIAMKTTYENELRSLQSWINNVNNRLASGGAILIDLVSANNTCYQIEAIANGIKEEYPVYAVELKKISVTLFRQYRTISLNNVVFGGLYIIIHHIAQEPVDMAVWREIHPRIVGICQGLFCDGYYDSAAEKAVKEVESRLRELFQELKPNAIVPTKVGEIIGALLTENGAYHFANLSTASGKDYRRGIQSLFEGILLHIETHLLMRIFHTQKENPSSRLCWQAS